MIAVSDAPGPGHNLVSPLDLIRERVEELCAATNDWNARVAEISDEHTAQRCDDFLNQLTAELKKLAEQEKAEKAPHQHEIKRIGLAYGGLRLVLETAKAMIQPKLRDWLNRKRERLAAEKARQKAEAARLAREAEIAAAKAGPTVESQVRAQEARRRAEEAAALADDPVSRAQVRGQYSPRARSLRVSWAAEVTDIVRCFIRYQDHPDVLAVLTKLASAEARATHGQVELPGCRLIQREVAA
jgi:hypothetical protein